MSNWNSNAQAANNMSAFNNPGAIPQQMPMFNTSGFMQGNMAMLQDNNNSFNANRMAMGGLTQDVSGLPSYAMSNNYNVNQNFDPSKNFMMVNQQQYAQQQVMQQSAGAMQNGASSASHSPPSQIEGYPHWLAYKTTDGEVYYFNTLTQVTQWDHPGALSSGVNSGSHTAGTSNYRRNNSNNNNNNNNRQNSSQRRNDNVNTNNSIALINNAVVGGGAGGGRSRLVVDGHDMGGHFIENAAGCNLFIFHLPSDWSDTDLYDQFSRFGAISSSMIVRERESGRNKGFGFVCYTQCDSASKAIAEMNGFAINGKRLTVQLKQQSVRRSAPGARNQNNNNMPHNNNRHLQQQQQHQQHHSGMENAQQQQVRMNPLLPTPVTNYPQMMMNASSGMNSQHQQQLTGGNNTASNNNMNNSNNMISAGDHSAPHMMSTLSSNHNNNTPSLASPPPCHLNNAHTSNNSNTNTGLNNMMINNSSMSNNNNNTTTGANSAAQLMNLSPSYNEDDLRSQSQFSPLPATGVMPLSASLSAGGAILSNGTMSGDNSSSMHQHL
eukprot:GDKJ01014642.1.p1 GENE.GDKJ01014642.1~~GDKJ01014642.1.p1  ORF type:complete len:550 (-),score=181.08 GDKJ01014642.1:3590-5239(-)